MDVAYPQAGPKMFLSDTDPPAQRKLRGLCPFTLCKSAPKEFRRSRLRATTEQKFENRLLGPTVVNSENRLKRVFAVECQVLANEDSGQP